MIKICTIIHLELEIFKRLFGAACLIVLIVPRQECVFNVLLGIFYTIRWIIYVIIPAQIVFI